MWITTTILMCLWAIGLELALRKRDRSNRKMVDAINAIAFGRAKITSSDGKINITYKKTSKEK